MSTLPREETVALIRLAQQGDADAGETLVRQNVPLVKSIVKRFLGRGCDYEDLYQLGCMGLYKAIMNFDPSMETQFSTYAVPMIMGEMRRHLRDDGTVKISRSLKALATKANAAINQFIADQGTEPSVEQLAQRLEVATEELLLALDSQRAVVSLDAPLSDDDGSSNLYALVGHTDDETLSVELGDLIGRLEERERQIILLRYFRGVTQSEIAERMGLSQAQVSRLENRALSRLRGAVEEPAQAQAL